ncbi:MAG: Sec-independent protein translocase protein TatB [Pseudomonadota bacterium]
MFDIGFWEVSLIGIVALLVVGPERLPGLIKTVGQLLGQVNRVARDFRQELEAEATMEEVKAFQKEIQASDALAMPKHMPGNFMNLEDELSLEPEQPDAAAEDKDPTV